MMKTVILAAGMGRRLADMLNGRPKPLFEIEGRSILERSLENLSLSGIREVTIAIGYKGAMIRKEIGNSFDKINIKYVQNPDYATTGSMHSLYLGLKSAENCLILDGDIIYDRKLINKLIKSGADSGVILTKCGGSGDEVHVLLDSLNRVSYLGKSFPGEKSLEFTGISKFSRDFMKLMFDGYEKQIANGKTSEYYEDCAFKASKLAPWYGIVEKRACWAEIDKREDIERAKRIL